MRLQMIALCVVGHPAPVTVPDVFAPTENLADETLGAVDRHVAFGERIGCRIDYFLGEQQTVVEIRREQLMGEMPILLEHCIFVFTKGWQNFFNKIFETG